MKNKLFFSLFLSVCICLGMEVVIAAPVDTATAKQAAVAFCQRHRTASVNPQLAYTQFINTGDATPAFYVFNLNKGFVIISADDSTDPILAYSDESVFDSTFMPSNMQSLLKDYVREIAVLKEHNAPSKWENAFDTHPKDTVTGIIVGPLLTSVWGQDTFYNEMCPVDVEGPNGHAVTGCVATAMAQVIRYWAYPTRGIGEIGYDHDYEDVQGSANYGYLYADFGNTFYDYANMPDKLDENSTQEEVTAVATLMYHCGISVRMMYGPNGSGAIGIMCPKALRENFGYPSDVHIEQRDNYSTSEWHEMIRHELDDDAPVMYSANCEEGGHEFICDGYSDDDYYHINWGWNGRFDGYYKLDLLNPRDYLFSSFHSIILNVRGTSTDVTTRGNDLIQVYPNPTENIITVQHGTNVRRIQVFDLCGKLIQTVETNGEKSLISLTSVAPGTYFLRLFDEQNVSVKKIIKR